MKHIPLAILIAFSLSACQSGGSNQSTNSSKPATSSVSGFLAAADQLLQADGSNTFQLFEQFDALEKDYINNEIGMKASEQELRTILDKRNLLINRQVDWLDYAIQELYKGEEADYVAINEKINFLSGKISELRRSDIQRKGELTNVRDALSKMYEFVELDKKNVDEMLFEVSTRAETLDERIETINTFLESNPNTLSKRKLSTTRGGMVLEYCSAQRAKDEDLSLGLYNDMISECRRYAYWVEDSLQKIQLTENEQAIRDQQGNLVLSLCANYEDDKKYESQIESDVFGVVHNLSYCDSLRQFLLDENKALSLDSLKEGLQQNLNDKLITKVEKDLAGVERSDLATLNYQIEENSGLVALISNVEAKAKVEELQEAMKSRRESMFIERCTRDKVLAKKLSLGELNDLLIDYESILLEYFQNEESKTSLRACLEELKQYREQVMSRELIVDLEKMKVSFIRDLKKSIKKKHEVCRVSRDFIIVKNSDWKKGTRETEGEVIKQAYELEVLLQAKSGALCKKTTRYKGTLKAEARLDPAGGVTLSKIGREGLQKL